MKRDLRSMPTAMVWARVRALGQQRVLGAPPGAASPAEVAAETDSIMVELNRYMSYAGDATSEIAKRRAKSNLRALTGVCSGSEMRSIALRSRWHVDDGGGRT